MPTLGSAFPHISAVACLSLDCGFQLQSKQSAGLKETEHNGLPYNLCYLILNFHSVVTCEENILKSRCYSAVVFLLTAIMKLNLYSNVKPLAPTIYKKYIYVFI